MNWFKVWTLMLAVALVAVLMGFCIVPMEREKEFYRLLYQMDASIQNLRTTDASIDRTAWMRAHAWTRMAYWHVCFSPIGTPERFSTAQLSRLRDDLDAKLKGRIDLDTLVWIWDRLAKTGPHGKRYVERFKPQFQKCFLPQAGTTRSASRFSWSISPKPLVGKAAVPRTDGVQTSRVEGLLE